jgi:hypothetical protein
VKNKMQVDSGPGVAPVPSGTAAASASTARDVGEGIRRARPLTRHETLPTSPIPSSPSAPSNVPPPGTLGSLLGLTARPELNGAEVRLLRFDEKANRFIVELLGRSASPIRIKQECFRRRAINAEGG